MIDPEAAVQILATAASGITSIDHADIYGDYRCETLFGDALRTAPGLRGRLQHVGKCDIMLLSSQFPARRVKHYDTTPDHIRASVQRSLQRLCAASGPGCSVLRRVNAPPQGAARTRWEAHEKRLPRQPFL